MLILSRYIFYNFRKGTNKILGYSLKILHFTIVRPVIKRLKDLLMKVKICLIKLLFYYDPDE